jgi:hypothetical protein
VHLASHEVVDHGAMILIAGFRTYWPNGTVSEFSRTRDGSHAINVVFENDGSISFMVNLYARQFRIESPARIEPRAGRPAASPACRGPSTGIAPYLGRRLSDGDWRDPCHFRPRFTLPTTAGCRLAIADRM